jgi:hypothetical protein
MYGSKISGAYSMTKKQYRMVKKVRGQTVQGYRVQMARYDGANWRNTGPVFYSITDADKYLEFVRSQADTSIEYVPM